jgi:hypothetical protein
MDDLPLIALLAAAALGVVATLLILRRQQSERADATRENPFAVSTEGMKRCPNCGFGNLVTDASCSSCGKRLPG